MKRRLPSLLAAALAALVLAHGAAWFWAVHGLERGYAAWLQGLRAEGWTAAAGVPERGGWPFAARLAVPGLRLSGGETWLPGGVAWQAERVSLTLTASRPRRLEVRLQGAQSLRFADGPPIPLGAERFEVGVPLDGQEAVDLDVEGLRAGLPWGELAAARVLARVSPLAVAVDASGVGLPAGPRWALGPAVERVRFEAALTLPVPPGPTPVRRAAAWQATGGRVRVDGLDARWGPLNVAGAGTGWLDQNLQPVAEARLRLVDYAAALDAMAAAGVLAPGAAVAAKAVLGLMARPGPGGPEAQVPLRLEGGVIGMGRTPLLRVPALAWPLP